MKFNLKTSLVSYSEAFRTNPPSDNNRFEFPSPPRSEIFENLFVKLHKPINYFKLKENYWKKIYNFSDVDNEI